MVTFNATISACEKGRESPTPVVLMILGFLGNCGLVEETKITANNIATTSTLRPKKGKARSQNGWRATPIQETRLVSQVGQPVQNNTKDVRDYQQH